MRAGEVAYQALKDEIIQWKLEPGAPLGEVETAARIGVSRTPVREALSRLVAEGLVTAGAGRTLTVSPLSKKTIIELFELREALEMQSARLAARRRNAEVFEKLRQDFQSGPDPDVLIDPDRPYFLAGALDLAIDEAASNYQLANTLRDIRGHFARIRRIAHHNPVRLKAATAEHLMIVEAILAQDETLACQATAVHLRNSLGNVLEHLEQHEQSSQAQVPSLEANTA
ncbi:GntR family transcriptional regulator [Pseudarthrobacter sp. B4EP4b]|uniref:GntR family transcriptional regulator n=1 Tax=Pseudarthrobacter sp. B4EP4b TaxID=2590664 RepID=UPI00114FE3E3|nr:GntR family transcriptional regulator [Pseudarthrobacter sp. B4EP4b]